MDLRVTLKFLKLEHADGPAVALRNTKRAFALQDPVYSVDNTQETIVCLSVEKGQEHRLIFDVLQPVRRVVLQGDDLSFSVKQDILSLTLPAFSANADRTADMHMIVHLPGIDLRLEVPNPLQRAGKYNDGEFPTRQRTAAANVQFAMLQAVQSLGLDQTIGKGPYGPIFLMGFDTNNPCGHTDWPPHVHMHMARPSYGAPIGHYYFDDTCLFSHNLLYHRGSKVPTGHFPRNTPCKHLAPDGSLLFDLMITRDGGLLLTAPDGHNALIVPIDAGFDRGALVRGQGTATQICCQDDDDHGLFNVDVDGMVTTYSYDVDTGRYLGASQQSALNTCLWRSGIP